MSIQNLTSGLPPSVDVSRPSPGFGSGCETQERAGSLCSVLLRYLDSDGRSIELDFVRGVAILLVIGFHALSPETPFAVFRGIEASLKAVGWSGVDLFFVLSGFLVGGVLLSEYKKTGALDVKRFIIRRGLKIWPAYYFYILFQVIVHRHPIHSFLWANLLHIQNYVGSSLDHTWTLSIEEHFYLFLSISIGWMVLRKWPIRKMIFTFTTLLAVVLAARCAAWSLGAREMAEHGTHTRIDSLLFGVILTALMQFYPAKFEWIAGRKVLLMSIWISAMAFMAYANHKPALLYTVGYTWIYLGYAAFMLLLYRHSGVIRHFVLYRVIAKIGVYSYGIYLWHLAVRDACFGIANHINPAVRWPIAMALEYATAIVLGTILTHLVEWPALRFRDRLFPAKDRLHSLIVSPDESNRKSPSAAETIQVNPTGQTVAAASH
ncbi:MAG TPA: acyltransferase [Candidatus Acidoferrales bacterium]|jgi:peptidoglycan/LPS O-acetylase OafA/YrhL|nr:acyltransferase [Candidatus Acidoferrales bacterium]